MNIPRGQYNDRHSINRNVITSLSYITKEEQKDYSDMIHDSEGTHPRVINHPTEDEVVYKKFFTPEGTPEHFANDPAIFFSEAQEYEFHQGNHQGAIAKWDIIAIDNTLTDEQVEAYLNDLAAEYTKRGYACMVSEHSKKNAENKETNRHGNILISARAIDFENSNAEHLAFQQKEQKIDKTDEQGKTLYVKYDEKEQESTRKKFPAYTKEEQQKHLEIYEKYQAIIDDKNQGYGKLTREEREEYTEARTWLVERKIAGVDKRNKSGKREKAYDRKQNFATSKDGLLFMKAKACELMNRYLPLDKQWTYLKKEDVIREWCKKYEITDKKEVNRIIKMFDFKKTYHEGTAKAVQNMEQAKETHDINEAHIQYNRKQAYLFKVWSEAKEQVYEAEKKISELEKELHEAENKEVKIERTDEEREAIIRSLSGLKDYKEQKQNIVVDREPEIKANELYQAFWDNQERKYFPGTHSGLRNKACWALFDAYKLNCERGEPLSKERFTSILKEVFKTENLDALSEDEQIAITERIAHALKVEIENGRDRLELSQEELEQRITEAKETDALKDYDDNQIITIEDIEADQQPKPEWVQRILDNKANAQEIYNRCKAMTFEMTVAQRNDYLKSMSPALRERYEEYLKELGQYWKTPKEERPPKNEMLAMIIENEKGTEAAQAFRKFVSKGWTKKAYRALSIVKHDVIQLGKEIIKLENDQINQNIE